MNEIIIKKINNTIKKEQVTSRKVERERITKIKVYNFLEEEKINSKTEKEIKRIMIEMFRKIKEEKNHNQLNKLYNDLLKVTNKETLISLFNRTIKESKITRTNEQKELQKIFLEKARNYFVKNPDYMLNLFVHTLVLEYFNIVAKKISTNSVEVLENLLSVNINDDKISDFLNDSLPSLNKETKLYELSKEYLIYAIKIEYNHRMRHLCWDCTINILDCPKILDEKKKSISNYDFIESGEQQFDRSGNLEKFVVTKCKKFTKKKIK